MKRIFSVLLLLSLRVDAEVLNLSLPPQSMEDIGRVLGYQDKAKLELEAKVFSERIASGFLPKGWKQSCLKEHSQALCSALDEYFSFAELSESKRKHRGRIPRFDGRKIKELQNSDFQNMLSSAPDWSQTQIDKFAQIALKTTDCPRNFSLVLARKAEVHFPDQKYLNLSLELGDHGLTCVEPSHDAAEYLYLRQGLLNYALKNPTKAILLLEKSLKAQIRKERYRSYFWLSRIYSEVKNVPKALEYKDLLVKEFPLSWMTIQTFVRNGADPLRALQNSKPYVDSYGSGDEGTDRRWAWLKALLYQDKSEYAVKRYTEFLMKRVPIGIRSAFLQHHARLLEAARFYRLQILVLSWVSSNQPQDVNLETLKLLYPSPYFSEIDLHTPNIDTALMIGLVRQESGFDVTARSSADAMGLFQVLPRTARTVKRGTKNKDLFDFQKNIFIGSKYFHKLVKLNKGSVEHSLAAYNAGQLWVNRWSKRFSYAEDEQLFVDFIPFRETRDYIPSILRNAYWYHRLLPQLNAEFQNLNKDGEQWFTSTNLKNMVTKSLDLARTPATKR